MAVDDRRLLEEQVAYYRARAAEYDVTSTVPDNPFAADADRIRAALRAAAPRGRVLELAAGTGQWTGLLADCADDLLVTDASPEMLELNAAKVGTPGIAYRVVDAFALEPTHDRDVVFFGFFLSHVPPGRFDAFWRLMGGLLVPGGRVLFVDETDHGLWEEEWVDREAGVVRRRLEDGTVHRAVKVLWRPANLQRRLTELGWTAAIERVGPFLWGTGSLGAQ